MKALIERLRELEKTENGKMGVSCVRSMLRSLDVGNVAEAQTIFGNEGDKVRQYPQIEKLLLSLLGCRLHSAQSCNDSLCSALRHSNAKRVAHETHRLTAEIKKT